MDRYCWTGQRGGSSTKLCATPHVGNLEENSKPLLLIGSPSCDRPAVVNKGNVDFGGGGKEQARAVLHLALICELYKIQVRRGRHFLHTHSHSADSLDQPPKVYFMKTFPDTFQTVTDSCLVGAKNLVKGRPDGHDVKTLTRNG